MVKCKEQHDQVLLKEQVVLEFHLDLMMMNLHSFFDYGCERLGPAIGVVINLLKKQGKQSQQHGIRCRQRAGTRNERGFAHFHRGGAILRVEIDRREIPATGARPRDQRARVVLPHKR